MQAHQGAQQDRTPLSWSPEMRSYTLREWSLDLLLWQLRSDPTTEDSRRAAAIVIQLRGSARVWSKQIPPQILSQMLMLVLLLLLQPVRRNNPMHRRILLHLTLTSQMNSVEPRNGVNIL